MSERSRVSLAELTSLQVGGTADTLLEPADTTGVVEVVRHLHERGVRPVVLGGGSNVVVSDHGIRRPVLRMLASGVAARRAGEHVELTVAAGEPLDRLVARTVSEGLAGIECLSGVPGTVGAAPVQNAGAYGQEIADVLTWVRVWDWRSGALRRLTPAECGFGYRTSIFKQRRDFLIVSVGLRLRASTCSAPIRYSRLLDELGVEAGGTAPIQEVAAAVLRLRERRGMMLDVGNPERRSAGSFFVYPPVRDWEALVRRVRAACGPAVHPPRQLTPDGRVLTRSSWLIEHAGYSLGHRFDRVRLSRRHFGALVTENGATAQEVRDAAEAIRTRVARRFGIRLTPEPVFIGDFGTKREAGDDRRVR